MQNDPNVEIYLMSTKYFSSVFFYQIHQVVLPLGIAAPVGLARLGLGAAAQVLLINPEIKDKVVLAAKKALSLKYDKLHRHRL